MLLLNIDKTVQLMIVLLSWTEYFKVYIMINPWFVTEVIKLVPEQLYNSKKTGKCLYICIFVCYCLVERF